MEAKKVDESKTIMTELVLPNDTNFFGNLMGGRLMYWMDIAAALTALKHCNKPAVTVSVDNLSFRNPIKLGCAVHIEGRVTRVFNSSLEIYLKVWGEDLMKNEKYESNNAYFTFVCIDEDGKPTLAPELILETEEEKQLYEGAMRRRQLRLMLAGKLKPDDATELKMLFD